MRVELASDLRVESRTSTALPTLLEGRFSLILPRPKPHSPRTGLLSSSRCEGRRQRSEACARGCEHA
eukprot:8658435-Alexandrium_andersonii.AAC.1